MSEVIIYDIIFVFRNEDIWTIRKRRTKEHATEENLTEIGENK